MIVLDIMVEGLPQAQGSKIQTPSGGLREANKNLRPWRDTLHYHMRDTFKGETVRVPVKVSLVFSFNRPKYHYNKLGLKKAAPLFKGTKPDLDKLTRAVLDSLTTATVISDDALVSSLTATKMYTEGTPGALIRVETEREVMNGDDDDAEEGEKVGT